ncbi:MAG: outer membrane lipoprotein-sorting protein [bacterium]
MKIFKSIVVLFSVVILLVAGQVNAEEPDAEKLANESYQTAYLPGDDVRWHAKMQIEDEQGNVRTRELTILRKDVGDDRQKYYSYFREPADLQGMVFMVHTRPGEDDDRWLYLSAVDMVQRITGRQKRNSFAGSNFTYEDMTGRHPDQDTFTYIGMDHIDGETVDIIRGNPKDKDLVEFSYYEMYISRQTKLPVKGVFYTPGGDKHRTLSLEEWEEIDGYVTPTVQKAVNHRTGGHTIAEMSKIEYNLGIEENVFTERYLRRPPTRWIQP